MMLTQTNNLKALTSLALMETQILSRDYLSTFLPFIATLALKKNYETIDIGVVVKEFRDEYGISIPRAPMQSILSKAVSAGLITSYQNGRYLPIVSEMQKISFLGKQGESNSIIEIILGRFVEFVMQKHDIIIHQSEAVDIFIRFLDEYSPRAITGEYDHAEKEQVATNKNLYLMGQFIQSAVKGDISLFETICRLSMAYLITTALTYDEPVEKRTDDLSEITIYLDTPIILRLLGLQTEELELSYKEMFHTFKTTINPTFLIFQHTLDEISGIIADCAHFIDNPAYNPIYANPALVTFIKREFSKTQVELYRATLKAKLKEMDIEIDSKEYYHVVHKSAQIDVSMLKERLIEAYKKNNPNYNVNNNSIDYDIRSIENVVKLWGTKSSSSYNNLGYLFITTNSTLAYVSRKFTSEYWWDGKNHKTPCVTDYYLGTMVWLSTPANKIKNVSKLKLLADCSAATTLSREVMEKFSHELEKLQRMRGIKDSDYLLLRKYAYEKNYLQDLTLNEDVAFKDDIIDQILEDIKADIQKPLVETIREKESQINSLESEKGEQNKLIQAFEQEKQRAQLQEVTEASELENLTNETVKRIINTYAPIAFAIFAFITIVLQLMPIFSDLSTPIKIVSAIVALGAAVFFGILKSNMFGAYSSLAAKIRRHYQVKRYKEKLQQIDRH